MDMLFTRYSIISPDGKKKAYVRLTADHDALDVANKVRSMHVFIELCAHAYFFQIGFI